MWKPLKINGWKMMIIISKWWFQIFFMFIPIWGRFPCWLIFFNWVETTNQISLCFKGGFRWVFPESGFCFGLLSYKILTGLFGGPGFMALVRYEQFIPPRMLARGTVCIEPNEIPPLPGKTKCNESSFCAFLSVVNAIIRMFPKIGVPPNHPFW